MPTEIFWTPENEEEADLIPAKVTEVRKIGRELRIFFSGQHGPTGDRFEGVLRLRLRPGIQKAAGNQGYKELDGAWELVPYSVTGQFESSRFETFSGTWTERGTHLSVDVVALPFFEASAVKKGKSAKSNKSRKRRTPR